MKKSSATRTFRIPIAFALALLFFTTSAIFLLDPVMGKSNIENLRIEKKGRLTIFNFNPKVQSIAKPISVRAVVSRETQFRVSFSIAKDFPRKDTVQLEAEKILWIQEREPAGKAYLPDSWAGVFLAFDGDFGYIQSRLRSHRVYRKHLDEFEIDYVFSSDSVSRSELVASIHAIDKEVFEVLKNSGAFSK